MTHKMLHRMRKSHTSQCTIKYPACPCLIHAFRGMGSGNRGSRPAQLKTVPSRRSADIENIPDKIEISVVSRLHRFEINFLEIDSARCDDCFIKTKQALHSEFEIFKYMHKSRPFQFGD